MSVVTDVILVLDVHPDATPQVDELNDWLDDHRLGELSQIDEYAGGRKAMQLDLWAGAFNHLPQEKFIEFANSREWPSWYTLLIQDEFECELKEVGSKKCSSL